MTALLSHVKTLHQEIDHLAALFADLNNPLIEHIGARMDELQEAVAALPTETDALRWWMWHSQAHQLRNLLTPIQGYARLMHIQPAQLGRTSYTPDENTQFERANNAANTINETLTAFVDEMRTLYRAEAEQPPQAMALHSALEGVWPIVRYTVHDTAVSLVPQIETDLPPVFYHPLHTTALIQHLIAVMSHEWMSYGPLTISTHARTDALALHFAAKGLRLSDEQWQGLFKNAADAVYYKRLTDMGGTLERLISQGTHDEGIILALPWAPPAVNAARSAEPSGTYPES